MENLSELENQAFTVSQFISQTNDFFKRLGNVLIKGEISQLSYHNHLYFSIKDENSLVDCLMFRGQFSKINFEPKVGHKVIIYGQNSLYSKNGSFKLLVSQMELAGLGQIMEQLRLLDLRLAQEGVYNVKRPFPEIIANVGVVTSTEGRVIDDIRTNVFRRNPLVNLYEFPCSVQGQEAPLSIVNALHQAYQAAAMLDLDIIIVGRGGGSFEDLLCFSDERVVRAVAQSPVPIISAVGHDEDRPLCDRSADFRVSTPTAAAELVTRVPYDNYVVRINNAYVKLDNQIGMILDDYIMRFNHLDQRLYSSPVINLLNNKHYQLASLYNGLDKAMGLAFSKRSEKINFLIGSLEQQGVNERLFRYQQRLDYGMARLESFALFIKDRSERLNRLSEYLLVKNFNKNFDHLSARLNYNVINRLEHLLQGKLYKLSDNLDRCCQALNDVGQRKLYELANHRANYINSLLVRLDQALNVHVYNAVQRLSLLENRLELGESYQNALPSYFDTKLMHGAKERLNQALAGLANIDQRKKDLSLQLEHCVIRLDHSFDRLIVPAFNEYESKIAHLITKLEALNPLYQLERGLSLTTKDGQHSVTGDKIQVGDELITWIKDYQVRSSVTAITKTQMSSILVNHNEVD